MKEYLLQLSGHSLPNTMLVETGVGDITIDRQRRITAVSRQAIAGYIGTKVYIGRYQVFDADTALPIRELGSILKVSEV